MSKEQKLLEFKKQYPLVTSADLQTFTLGMNACDDVINSLEFIITDIVEALENRDKSLKSWVEERLKEHNDIFS